MGGAAPATGRRPRPARVRSRSRALSPRSAAVHAFARVHHRIILLRTRAYTAFHKLLQNVINNLLVLLFFIAKNVNDVK